MAVESEETAVESEETVVEIEGMAEGRELVAEGGEGTVGERGGTEGEGSGMEGGRRVDGEKGAGSEYDLHSLALDKLCRVCSRSLSCGRTTYLCKTIASDISTTFKIDVSEDKPHIHPGKMCKN